MNDVIEFMSTYGITSVLFAIGINILTWGIKLPIKALASRLKDSTTVTRFLVFLPIVLGFLLAMAYTAAINRSLVFDEAFYRLWLSSSSLSLTFYAVFEKIFPGKKKVLSDDEIAANKQLIDEIKTATGLREAQSDTDTQTQTAAADKQQAKQHFILGRRNDEQTETES